MIYIPLTSNTTSHISEIFFKFLANFLHIFWIIIPSEFHHFPYTWLNYLYNLVEYSSKSRPPQKKSPLVGTTLLLLKFRFCRNTSPGAGYWKHLTRKCYFMSIPSDGIFACRGDIKGINFTSFGEFYLNFSFFFQSLMSVDPGREIHALKKGLLWQQRERLFSRWKERYFILTRDYLHCFKRSSGNEKISNMGQFIFKVKFYYYRFSLPPFLLFSLGISFYRVTDNIMPAGGQTSISGRIRKFFFSKFSNRNSKLKLLTLSTSKVKISKHLIPLVGLKKKKKKKKWKAVK